MKVVILCGGKGERLKEHTETIPKPLIEIGSKPILWHIMEIYAHHGFKNFVLCLGYKGEKIKEYFSANNNENWNIEFANTGSETNTGGRIKRIEKYIKDENFFATYGDGLSDINIKELFDFHKKMNKTATMTCVSLRSNFGIVDINNNLVNGFKEKPFMDMWINGGFFVFNRKIFDYIDENSILEGKPMEMLADNKELAAYKYKGFWECMDTYKDTRILNQMHDNGQAKWMVWQNNKDKR